MQRLDDTPEAGIRAQGDTSRNGVQRGRLLGPHIPTAVVVVALAGAVLAGLAGLGLGLTAFVSVPRTGPQGPQGPPGASGPWGSAGKQKHRTGGSNCRS